MAEKLDKNSKHDANPCAFAVPQTPCSCPPEWFITTGPKMALPAKTEIIKKTITNFIIL